MSWLPLAIHLVDSAQVAKRLWRDWVPEGVKHAIASGLRASPVANAKFQELEELTEQLFIFLASAHDLGKVTPVFQANNSGGFSPNLLDTRLLDLQLVSGLPMPFDFRDSLLSPGKTPHALATQYLLEKAGCNKKVAAVLGAHHGKPPNAQTYADQLTGAYAMNYHMGKAGKEAWGDVQCEMLGFILDLAALDNFNRLPIPNLAAQVLLSGLVIMTDWIASNEEYFPYIALSYAWETMLDPEHMKMRSAKGIDALNLTNPWNAGTEWMYTELYQKRFAGDRTRFIPHLMQQVVAKLAGEINQPGIMVIEAAMGQGKTEAALVAAEIFAFKANRSGIFFALPTQATSDGIFSRIEQWVRHLDTNDTHSIRLAHGKAQFNKNFQSIFEGSVNIGGSQEGSGDNLVVHQWFEGRKKALLADFVVGTIDQLLLAALKQKHVMLRHLGLAGKVVIIDECHAYDAYMSQYLNTSLAWLGAYQVPVIVLSATLPAEKRRMVINAYLNQSDSEVTQQDDAAWTQSRGYPLITWTDGNKVRQAVVPPQGEGQTVVIDCIHFDALEDRLQTLLSDGGCVGLVLNTVKRAQEVAKRLQRCFRDDTVKLLHSRFLGPDRAVKEQDLLRELGKQQPGEVRPQLRIVVGSQVLEQSLDIDFDLLITDLCPMDLLLQRIGRLHRHDRMRPEKLQMACCMVIDLDVDQQEEGSSAIYGDYLLARTKALLPKQLLLPDDIPRLVQDVYNDTFPLVQEPPGYAEAEAKHWHLIADKRRRAESYRIDLVWPDDPLQWMVGWLDTDVSDKDGDAAVRDSDESIEVLLIQKKADARLYFLPWLENGQEINLHQPIDNFIAQALARQSIRLPGILCKSWIINKTLKQLEDINWGALQTLQQSPWLKGLLVLPLDEHLSASLAGYRLHYDQSSGLTYEKEDCVDE